MSAQEYPLVEYSDFEYTTELVDCKLINGKDWKRKDITVSNGYVFSIELYEDESNKSFVYMKYMTARSQSKLSLLDVVKKISNGKARAVTTAQKMQERNERFKDRAHVSVDDVYTGSGVIVANVTPNTTPSWQIDNGGV